MNALTALLVERAREILPRDGEYALHARQRTALAALADLVTMAADVDDLLLVAEHLREGRSVIDRLTGRAGTEAMLDALFGQFCIGK
jgi:tRNA modification GTPase